MGLAPPNRTLVEGGRELREKLHTQPEGLQRELAKLGTLELHKINKNNYASSSMKRDHRIT